MKKIYIASKTKHADKWIGLKNSGVNIISTWIYEAGVNESKDLKDLSIRCIEESFFADALIIYCKPGEILKGALLEVGSSLGAGKSVYCVGMCDSYPTGLANHPNWHDCNSIQDALEKINKEVK